MDQRQYTNVIPYTKCDRRFLSTTVNRADHSLGHLGFGGYQSLRFCCVNYNFVDGDLAAYILQHFGEDGTGLHIFLCL